MKIYFTGSVGGGRGDCALYFELIQHLKKFGQVLTEHIGDCNISHLGETNLPTEKIHDRDRAWLKEADVLIAEISTPSLGVGYELGKAEEWEKKNLCLYRLQDNKRVSNMIKGSKFFNIQEYNNLDEAFKYIDDFFKEIK